MTHHPNTPASRNEEVAAVLQSILADACDSESETNVPAELYRRGVEALAASRTEQAAPSVASGVVALSDALKQWAWHWFGPEADEQWIAQALANMPKAAAPGAAIDRSTRGNHDQRY